MTLFSTIAEDLRSHGGKWSSPGFWAVAVHRFGHWRYSVRFVLLRKICSAIYKVLFRCVQILTGIELPCEARIGRNFVIDHAGGIVVSGYASFGDNCRIRTGVVVGLSRTEDPCAPQIGDNVDVGAGAKLLGRIVIGNNVLVGANAVVLTDVPDDAIAVGVPARIKPRKPMGPVPRPRREPVREFDAV